MWTAIVRQIRFTRTFRESYSFFFFNVASSNPTLFKSELDCLDAMCLLRLLFTERQHTLQFVAFTALKSARQCYYNEDNVSYDTFHYQ